MAAAHGQADRVLVLGLDGGTETVLRPAFERGWMPRLADFWRRSARGALRSSDPMVTPVAWTSFLTGCEPPTHGIHEFYSVDPADRTIHPNHAGRIRVPTLWHVLDAHDRPVVSVNLPMTYPPPKVRGLVVGGSDAPGLDWAFMQCPEFGGQVKAALPGFSTKIVWKRRPRSLAEMEDGARRTCQVFEAQARAALLGDARTPDWAVLLVHFHNLDSLQHRIWPYLDLDGEDAAADGPPSRAWHDAAVSCLRALDDAIGMLLDLADRRGAAVVAASDHGFGRCRKLVSVNGLLQRNGLQKGLAYGTRFSYRFHRAADRFRRWQARREGDGASRRQPRSIRGQVGCDWSRTAAFAPYGQLGASIFLNPDVVGAMASATADRARGEVLAMCRAARDPETGSPLFADVFEVAERYGLDPEAEGLPDVLATSADGFQAQAKWGALDRSWTRPDWNLPATHYLQGIVAVGAPGVRPGRRLSASLPDLAPTILAMLGLPAPEYMEGRVIQEAFAHPLAVPDPSLGPEFGPGCGQVWDEALAVSHLLEASEA
jgi:predicted AlkP superfamily phosphohydrolase/phosphomutase